VSAPVQPVPCCWKRRPDYIRESGRDILDTVPLPGDGYVVVVGARGKPFGLLELDLRTLKLDELSYAISQERADAEVRRARPRGTDLIHYRHLRRRTILPLCSTDPYFR